MTDKPSSADIVQAAMQECVDIAMRYDDCGGEFIAQKIRDRILSLQSTAPVEAATPLDPCPYAIDGCVLENEEIGPCLCVNHVRSAAQPSQQLREAVAAAHAAFQAIPIGYPIQQNGRTIDHTLLNEAKRLCEEAMAMTLTDQAEPGWSAAQFWEYVEGLTDAHVMGQIRDMLSSQGLSVSRPHREAGQ